MSITINTNTAALNAQRWLGNTNSSLRSSFEKLSSGLRITRAKDDAAGLAIAENLRAQSSLATVAMRNANDGVNLITITDGALGEITNTLVRMGELAEQSANGVLSGTQRSALQQEFSFLGSEIQRISETTQFNNLNLLSSAGEISFQIGIDGSLNSQISFSGIEGTLESLGLASQGSNVLLFSLTTTGTVQQQQAAARSALDAITNSITSVTSRRGTLGATESRLSVAINNLALARENWKVAESQIRDVDVAEEASKMTRLNILQQAGSSVLAQANQLPSMATQLLG